MMNMNTKKYNRAAVQRDSAKPVLILFPPELLSGINKAVLLLDTDRSKFIRNAVRARLDALAVGSDMGVR